MKLCIVVLSLSIQMFAVVPGKPKSVTVKEKTSDLVRLTVEPPDVNDGENVIGYRVEFENIILEFIIGNVFCFVPVCNRQPCLMHFLKIILYNYILKHKLHMKSFSIFTAT